MRRFAATLVMTIVVATALSACGGGSAYCDTVKKDKNSLNNFGQTRTDAAYTKYAKVFSDVAKVSPAGVKDDWTALADATKGIMAAQKASGIPLEQMTDTAKVKSLGETDLAALNKAYKTFNATTAQRTAVVKNVLQQCDIKLK
ncbi:hypothetical protein [Aeromicrobium sp.]|uniref:hypothetical protein n=1 Tax=Aeromicrobium sp. TaxID=1871063 RepID=UPI0019B519D1|nr:hypothetical protein [Aeromicrobium sp.]MBC7631474.1 hypothetical protein [Aeromicrobium sp.]